MAIIASEGIMAIPIALASLSILFAGIYNGQSYLSAYSGSEYRQIRYYSISQQMDVAASAASGGYQNKTAAAEGVARYYSVSAILTSPYDSADCMRAFCRIMEIGGITRLAVIK